MANRKPKTIAELNQVEMHRFFAFVIPFVWDVAAGAVVLFVIWAYGWLIHFGNLMSSDGESLEIFSRVHYWVNFATYCILSVDFLVRLSAGTIGKEKS